MQTMKSLHSQQFSIANKGAVPSYWSMLCVGLGNDRTPEISQGSREDRVV